MGAFRTTLFLPDCHKAGQMKYNLAASRGALLILNRKFSSHCHFEVGTFTLSDPIYLAMNFLSNKNRFSQCSDGLYIKALL